MSWRRPHVYSKRNFTRHETTMIIDIKKTIIRKNLGYFIVTIAFLILIVVLLFIPFQKDFIPGVSNNLLAIFIGMAYVINAFYQSFRNYNYIFFSDESDNLVLRFFSPNLFTSKKHSIEIPKNEFAGYTRNSFFMGYREKITLYRKTKKGMGKYPAVSITALSVAERQLLLSTLDKLKQKNES
jgi:hypothetical protein